MWEKSATTYIVKPVDLEQFFQVARLIEGFWLELVTCPQPKLP